MLYSRISELGRMDIQKLWRTRQVNTGDFSIGIFKNHITEPMTVVRRPARVTHSCCLPGDHSFWANDEPSKLQMVRSESTRIMLENHFNGIISEFNARQRRYERFQDRLRSEGVSQEVRDQLTRDFLESEREITRMSRSRIKESRFERIRLIGRGGCADVYLVQDKHTFEYFALKVLSKAEVILLDQVSNVRTERDVLSAVDNQWVVQLKASFQDSENLYLVLEYVPGGDLMTAMMRAGVFPEATARFFAGEIVLALNSIHRMNVIHRDLKMENILIREDGHIKLTDFGLSMNYQEKTSERIRAVMDELRELVKERVRMSNPTYRHVRGTEFGTYGYTAPEILKGETPTAACDYWSLGVILYEMLFGFAPFNGKSQRETAFRVLHYRKALRFPANRGVSPAAIDLLKHLLCEPSDRYGFEEVMHHPFFNGFNFEHAEVNVPPLVPVLTSPLDTSHFDPINENPRSGAVLDDDFMRAAFLGFTYHKKPRNMTLAKLGIFA